MPHTFLRQRNLPFSFDLSEVNQNFFQKTKYLMDVVLLAFVPEQFLERVVTSALFLEIIPLLIAYSHYRLFLCVE